MNMSSFSANIEDTPANWIRCAWGTGVLARSCCREAGEDARAQTFGNGASTETARKCIVKFISL